MPPQDKELNVLLKFLVDKQGQSSVNKSTEEIKKDLQKLEQQLIKTQFQMASLSQRATEAQQSFKKLFVASTALAGSIYAMGASYVKNTKESSALTRDWNNSMKSIQESQSKIGKEAAEAVLPALKIAADLASKVAGFVEKNPDIMKAAVSTGVVVSALSVLGMIVSKGVSIYADIKFIAAATEMVAAGKLMDGAADKMLLAGGGKAGAGGLISKGVTALGGAAVLGPVVATTLSILAGMGLGIAGYDKFAKETGGARANVVATGGAYKLGQAFGSVAEKFGMDPKEAERKSIVFAALIGKWTKAIDETSPLFIKAAASIEKAKEALEEASLAGSQFEEQIVNAYMQWKEQDKQIVQDVAKQRAQITKDGADAEIQLVKNYNQNLAQITAQSSKERVSIMSNYVKSEEEAAASYAANRASIIAQSNLDIQRLEEDHKRAMAKLAQDHNDNVDGLLRTRDALGLVKEKRRYERERREAEDAKNLEIKRRREDIGLRLQELAQQYAQEKAQRLAQYQEQLKENAARTLEARKAATAQFMEERARIQQQTAQKLRDLQEASNAERTRLRENFIAQVRDLDAALINERGKKQQYYSLMLADAERFLSSYRGSMAQTPQKGKKYSGGYASYGQYLLGDNPSGGPGSQEFVMSGSTTKAAEEIIGSQLTQQSLIRALTGGGAQRQQVVVNDYRRIDSRLSPSDRRAINQDLRKTLKSVFS